MTGDDAKRRARASLRALAFTTSLALAIGLTGPAITGAAVATPVLSTFVADAPAPADLPVSVEGAAEPSEQPEVVGEAAFLDVRPFDLTTDPAVTTDEPVAPTDDPAAPAPDPAKMALPPLPSSPRSPLQPPPPPANPQGIP